MSEPQDPIALFREWQAQANATDLREPDAATLATVGRDGMPSARVVLVRSADDRGFVFYTNSKSRKGDELISVSPDGAPAALCFWWPPLTKQVRVEGRALRIPDPESDAYWATRHRASQVAAWCSLQSAVLEGGRPELLARFEEWDRKFHGDDPIPRPAIWFGYSILPERIEFWEGREHRLHHRVLYTREGRNWTNEVLSP